MIELKLKVPSGAFCNGEDGCLFLEPSSEGKYVCTLFNMTLDTNYINLFENPIDIEDMIKANKQIGKCYKCAMLNQERVVVESVLGFEDSELSSGESKRIEGDICPHCGKDCTGSIICPHCCTMMI